MARIRTIKPEFFTDSKVLRLTPLARLFYVSLWCEADKQGRLKWDPETLKYRYLPADKAKPEDLGQELVNGGLIRLYEVDGQIHADIPGFIRHQVINNRESESSLPPFTNDARLTRESGVPDAACGKEGRKGREGKEGISAPKVANEPQKFLELVEAYPKRDGTNPKPPALRAWKKHIAAGVDPDEMIAGAKAYARTDVAGTKFCKQLVNWLTAECWREFLGPARAPEKPRDEWRGRLTTWAASPKAPDQRWWHYDWGPAPHKPDTKVPAEILREFGVAA